MSCCKSQLAFCKFGETGRRFTEKSDMSASYEGKARKFLISDFDLNAASKCQDFLKKTDLPLLTELIK